MEKNDLEALKMLADWAKWIVMIESGLISIIGVALSTDKINILKSIPVIAAFNIILAISAFFISLMGACFLLYSLPGIAQRLPPTKGDIYSMGTLDGKGIQIVIFSAIEVIGFAIGIYHLFILALCLISLNFNTSFLNFIQPLILLPFIIMVILILIKVLKYIFKRLFTLNKKIFNQITNDFQN